MAWRGAFGLVKKTFRDFMDDECPRLAAALSYYTVFSLPPLLILILLLLGAVMDPADVRDALGRQVSGLMGPSGAEQVQTIIAEAKQPGSGPLAGLLGVAALVLGATGAFLQLQSALNRAWEVEPDPGQGGLKNFVLKRVLSLGMVLGIAFLLLVSLAVSALLSEAGHALTRMLPGVNEALLYGLNLVLSFAVITLLFATMFKVLPDARIAWRDVWVGAVVTALLFVIGKFALGFYLGRSNPGQAFGAAGSLALVLVWIYYSSMILLFGAEFTQTWAVERGGGITPEPGARRMVDEVAGGKERAGDPGAGGRAAAAGPAAGAPASDPSDRAKAATPPDAPSNPDAEPPGG